MSLEKAVKVLIVEDEKDLRLNLEDILQCNGFETATAKDGLEGYNRAIEFEPDIIISDIRMPELDGFELLKKLQENSKTKSIPFIFLTAKVENEDIRMGMVLGADDYITKPFKIQDVLDAINTRLQKHNFQKEKLINFKDDFCHNASHNLRTPLVSILGFSEILLNEYYNIDDEERLSTIRKIKRAGERLKEDVNKFLYYSQFISNNLENIEINEIYDIYADKINSLLLKKALEYNREKDLQININAFQTNIKSEILEFLLVELLDNALKNSIEGTPIIISMECKDGNNIFKITDYGSGVNLSKIKNLNGFTLQNFSKKNKYDLGISLTIIKKIVKLYKGLINIISIENSGTEVIITVPLVIINNKAI